MKKYISLFLLATAAIFTSCVDDEGSYDLSPINEMEVTISNEDGYTAYIMGDPVLISADVKVRWLKRMTLIVMLTIGM